MRELHYLALFNTINKETKEFLDNLLTQIAKLDIEIGGLILEQRKAI